MAVQFEDIVKVTVEGVGVSGQDIQNTFHMQNRGGVVSDALALDDLVEVLEALYVLLSAFLSTLLVIRDIRALNVTQDVDIGLGLFVDDTPGAGVGDVMPPQNALGLTLSTARLKVRGRKSFGIILESSANDAGVVEAAAILDVADVGDYCTEVQSATNTDWEFGVIATFDDAWLPFTGYSIPTTVVSQRRRRRGVGS